MSVRFEVGDEDLAQAADQVTVGADGPTRGGGGPLAGGEDLSDRCPVRR